MLDKVVSLQNPFVKHLVRLRKNKAYRKDHKAILIANRKMLEELPCGVKTLLLLEGEECPDAIKADKVIVVTEAVLKKATGLESPERVAGEVEMPAEDPMELGRRFLVLDGVSDPGNMGTLLRTALALGWDGVYILDACVDPFNEKALRASKGALFHLPYKWLSHEAFLQKIKDDELLVADVEGERIENCSVKGKMILVLGNEARGLSRQLQGRGRKVMVPMKGEMESLNVAVAGGILMYLLNGEL